MQNVNSHRRTLLHRGQPVMGVAGRICNWTLRSRSLVFRRQISAEIDLDDQRGLASRVLTCYDLDKVGFLMQDLLPPIEPETLA